MQEIKETTTNRDEVTQREGGGTHRVRQAISQQKGTISTQYSALVVLLIFYLLPYFLFAGDKGDKDEGGAATNKKDARGEGAITEELAPAKAKASPEKDIDKWPPTNK